MPAEIVETNDTNVFISNYLVGLYRFLGDKYCFLSGSFIIHDPTEDLFNHLLIASPKGRQLEFDMFKSHQSLRKKNVINEETNKKDDTTLYQINV